MGLLVIAVSTSCQRSSSPTSRKPCLPRNRHTGLLAGLNEGRARCPSGQHHTPRSQPDCLRQVSYLQLTLSCHLSSSSQFYRSTNREHSGTVDSPMVSSTSAGRRAVVENARVYAALATGIERAAARRSCGRMVGRGGRIGPGIGERQWERSSEMDEGESRREGKRKARVCCQELARTTRRGVSLLKSVIPDWLGVRSEIFRNAGVFLLPFFRSFPFLFSSTNSFLPDVNYCRRHEFLFLQ